MRSSATFVLLLASGSSAQNSPGDSTCENFSGLSTENYWVSSWVAEPYAPEGQQCITLDKSDEKSISWHANWTWSEDATWMISAPYSSIPNFKQHVLGDIASLPTAWEWSFEEGTDTKASAAYWLHGDGGCMSMVSWYLSIWLQKVGDVVPNDGYGNTGEVIDTATISGVTFDIHKVSPNMGSARLTYVFVAQEDQTSFSGDLLEFLKWPGENDGRPLNCVWGVQAGADVYSGKDAQFTTKRYSLEQNLV